MSRQGSPPPNSPDHTGPLPRNEVERISRELRQEQHYEFELLSNTSELDRIDPPPADTQEFERLRRARIRDSRGLGWVDPDWRDPITRELDRIDLPPDGGEGPEPEQVGPDGRKYEYPEVISDSSSGSVVGGLGWQSLSAMVTQGGTALVAMVVAAIVPPHEYALISIMAILFQAQFLTQTLGLGTALVHYDDRPTFRQALDGAAWLNLFFGLTVAGIVFVSAPWLATLFGEGFEYGDVVTVIRVMSLIFLAAAAIEIPQGIIEKTRDFRRRAIPEIGGVLGYMIFVVVMLVLGAGVWSSIWGRIVQYGLFALGLQFLAPMRPRLLPRIHWSVVRQLVSYGKFLGVSTIFTFVLGTAGSMTIGALAGATAMGAYGLAFTITNLVPTFLGQTLGKVFFPLYASIRHDRDRLMPAFSNATHLTAVVMLPVTGLFVTVGPDAFVYLFGPEWDPARPLVRILALYGLGRAVSNTTVQLLNATGRPNFTMWNSVLATVIPLLLVWPASRYGAVGITAAFTIGQLVSMAVTVSATMAYATLRLVKYLLPPAAATAAAIVEALAVSQILHGRLEGLSAGIIEVAVFGLTYLIGLVSLDAKIRGMAVKVLGRLRPGS